MVCHPGETARASNKVSFCWSLPQSSRRPSPHPSQPICASTCRTAHDGHFRKLIKTSFGFVHTNTARPILAAWAIVCRAAASFIWPNIGRLEWGRNFSEHLDLGCFVLFWCQVTRAKGTARSLLLIWSLFGPWIHRLESMATLPWRRRRQFKRGRAPKVTKTRPQQPRLAAPNGHVYLPLPPHYDLAKSFCVGRNNLEDAKVFPPPSFS